MLSGAFLEGGVSRLNPLGAHDIVRWHGLKSLLKRFRLSLHPLVEMLKSSGWCSFEDIPESFPRGGSIYYSQLTRWWGYWTSESST